VRRCNIGLEKNANGERHDLYALPITNQIKREIGVACDACGENRDAYRVLVGKPEGKTKLGKSRCRWEENVKMNLKQIGGDGVDWNDPAQNRSNRRVLVNAVKNFRVNEGNFLTS
jgi:hypothetical protein